MDKKNETVAPVQGTVVTGAPDQTGNGAVAPENSGNVETKQDAEQHEESLSFLMEVDMNKVAQRLTKERNAQSVGVQVRSLRLVELTRDDGSIYHKFAVNLKQSVRAMINKGSKSAPDWQPGYSNQVWLFPNQVLRALVEGGLDERYITHLQSNMAIEVLINSFLAGSLMHLLIEPVTAEQIYYSPFTGEERGVVKNTSFYYLPFDMVMTPAGRKDLEEYIHTFTTTFAIESVKAEMLKKR